MKNKHTPAIEALLAGYNSHDPIVFNKRGQEPKVLIIACCDSRVDPAILFNCEPGDIFVVRNIANLVPPYKSDEQHHGTSAALEFGVKSLGVTDIVILGHRDCGGIQALMSDGRKNKTDFINSWMNIAASAKVKALKAAGDKGFESQCRHGEKASLQISLENLNTFPWIQEKVVAGTLSLHAWYFDLKNGVLEGF